MDPDKFFTPKSSAHPPAQSSAGQPGVYGPQVPPSAPQSQYGGSSPAPLEPKKKNKTLIIVSIAVGVLIGLTIIVAVIVSSSDKSANQKQQTVNQDTTTQPEILEPAQSIEVEQTSNSLSQDLSSLDDEKDLPANSLEDKTLGL